MADLMMLARYNMVGSGLAQRTGRTPTMVLSSRLARNDAMQSAPSLSPPSPWESACFVAVTSNLNILDRASHIYTGGKGG